MSINMLDLEPCGLLMFACLLMSELKGGWEKRKAKWKELRNGKNLFSDLPQLLLIFKTNDPLHYSSVQTQESNMS